MVLKILPIFIVYQIAQKFGGSIGWVDEKELSKKIFNQIKGLKINEFTDPIQNGGSFLIIKIDDVKYIKKKINIKKELNKKINFETERQLQQFSKIYYNMIKINTNIDEL